MQTFPGDPEVRITRVADVDTDGYRVTRMELGSHAGTHVDAPAHTEPDGKTLEEYPVERFVLEAVRVDCRDLDSREPIPPDRVPDTGADCLVFSTGWDEHWGADSYLDHPYLAVETAERCVENGYDVGLDTVNPDPTPTANAKPDEPEGLTAHHALLGNDCLIVENLTGLDDVPERFEFRVSPLPIRGDGAPVRAVAVDRV